MTRTRLIAIGAIVLMIGIPLLTWFLAIQPQLQQANTANSERSQVETINRAHEATLVELRDLDENLDELEVELADLSQMVPGDAAISTLLGQLDALAEEAGVAIVSIRAELPEYFAPDGKKPQPPKTPSQTAGGSAETAVTDDVATIGDTGMITLPIKIEVLGDRDATLKFTQLAQHGTRLYLVTDMEIVTAPDDGTNTILEGLVFVLLDRRAALEINE